MYLEKRGFEQDRDSQYLLDGMKGVGEPIMTDSIAYKAFVLVAWSVQPRAISKFSV